VGGVEALGPYKSQQTFRRRRVRFPPHLDVPRRRLVLKERVQNQEVKQRSRLTDITEKLGAVTLTIRLLGEVRE
jgi:hypothetical protein